MEKERTLYEDLRGQCLGERAKAITLSLSMSERIFRPARFEYFEYMESSSKIVFNGGAMSLIKSFRKTNTKNVSMVAVNNVINVILYPFEICEYGISGDMFFGAICSEHRKGVKKYGFRIDGRGYWLRCVASKTVLID